jgi:hypothetical protein
MNPFFLLNKSKQTMRLVFFSAFTFATLFASGQDSSRLRISLLTCTPGQELYSTFGHTAIRVIDSNSLTDYVYNFGTFDFEDPNFYLKFVKGKLLYFLSAEPYADFAALYRFEGRGITEQLLNLDAAEKDSTRRLLNQTLREENRYYLYDFFFDNCTTRPRDIIVRHQHPLPALPAVLREGTTFRHAIHHYLDKYDHPWSKLGIDLLLGAPTDAVMKKAQEQFLPEILMQALDSSKPAGSRIAAKQELVADRLDSRPKTRITPMLLFAAFALLLLISGYYGGASLQAWLRRFDALLFLLAGLVGVVLVFMWTGTNHAMCRYNLNLFWALPTHAVFAFLIFSKKAIVRRYFGATALLNSFLLLGWFFLPQQLNPAFIPLVLLLMFRAAGIYYRHVRQSEIAEV